jgi:hypothetical protein
MTSYALIAFLLAWAFLERSAARSAETAPRAGLWLLALAGVAIVALWGALIAPVTSGYLGPVFGKAGSSLFDLILGESGPKRVFAGAGVPSTPLAEQVLGFGAVALALTALPFGIWQLRRRVTPLRALLAIAGVLYPATLALRLTQAGTEISNRASEFVFVGIAFLAATALTAGRSRAPAWVRRRLSGPTPIALIATAAILFAGGIVIGWARYSRVPGPYMVVADERSVEREGIKAARWARRRLPPRSRILTDRSNSLLMGSIGRQDPQGGDFRGHFVGQVITAPKLRPHLRHILVGDDLSYLMVDRRLADGLPAVGVYFESDEPHAYHHVTPPSESALVKYDGVCPISRVFDSGDIIIYDTRPVAVTAYYCHRGA